MKDKRLPFLDACMRALKANGWINFRMRAMLVSFAAYHLWIDWRVFKDFLACQFVIMSRGFIFLNYRCKVALPALIPYASITPSSRVRITTRRAVYSSMGSRTSRFRYEGPSPPLGNARATSHGTRLKVGRTLSKPHCRFKNSHRVCTFRI